MLALLLCCLCQISQPAGANSPDVLVVILDDVGLEAVSATPTPTLDALATQGSSFKRAYAMPVCSPTRYGILFGRWPRRAGVGGTIDALDPLGSDAPSPDRRDLSMAEVFKARGYRTALIGKWHLGVAGIEDTDAGPHVQGFDDWLAGMVNTTGTFGDSNYAWRRTDNGVVTQEMNYTGDEQRDAFVSWWAENAGSPRFAVLSFAPPHAPYEPPPGVPDAGIDRQNYLNALTYVDGLLGNCLSGINLSQTAVIVVGDNGTPGGVRPPGAPGARWKGTTYEGGVRVPLIVAGAGIPLTQPQAITSVVDIPRMLFDYLGWGVPGFEDSQSFKARTWLVVERYRDGGPDDLAIIEERWKYRRVDIDGSGVAPATEQVFDLLNDPQEQNPFGLTHPAVALEVPRLLAEKNSLPPRL